MIKIELQGFENAVRMFEKLGVIGEQALYTAMVETAIEATSVMKVNSPVVTNRLRSSMHFETPRTKEYLYKDYKGRGFNGGFSFRPIGLSVAFGTNVNYAEAANEHSSSPHFFEKAKSQALKVLPIRLQKNYQKAVDNI